MNCLMPSSRNMARMAGLYAARTLGPACAQSASSGRFTWYSTPFSRMEQPPVARTLRDQSDWLRERQQDHEGVTDEAGPTGVTYCRPDLRPASSTGTP